MRNLFWILVLLALFAPSARAQTTRTFCPQELACTWQASQTYNGNVTATVGQNSISAYNLNGVTLIDSNFYAATSAGINQANSNVVSSGGGTINAQGLSSLTSYSSEIDLGSSLSDVPVNFIHPMSGTWTPTMTNGTSCGIKLGSYGSITGAAAGSAHGWALQPASGANMDSILCTSANANYFHMENTFAWNPNGATLAHGALYIPVAQDASSLVNVRASNFSGIGANINNVCCSFYTLGLSGNGQGGTGAQPFVLGGYDTSVVFYSTSFTNPGNGYSTYKLTGTGCPQVSFIGLYTEIGGGGTTDTTTPAIDDGCTYGSDFFNVSDGSDLSASTRYLLKIESNSLGVNVFDASNGTSGNIINDLATGFNVSVSTPSKSVPIDYISMPFYLVNKGPYGSITTPSITDTSLTAGNCVQAGTGGLLGTAAAPCGGASSIHSVCNASPSGTISSSSAVSLGTCSVTMPSSGCPCRALISYSLYLDYDSYSNSTATDIWVNDGSHVMAGLQTGQSNAESGAKTSGSYSGISTYSYSNSANVTFTLYGQTTSSSVNVDSSPAAGSGPGSQFQISILFSVN